jgi:hypothetical protein
MRIVAFGHPGIAVAELRGTDAHGKMWNVAGGSNFASFGKRPLLMTRLPRPAIIPPENQARRSIDRKAPALATRTTCRGFPAFESRT